MSEHHDVKEVRTTTGLQNTKVITQKTSVPVASHGGSFPNPTVETAIKIVKDKVPPSNQELVNSIDTTKHIIEEKSQQTPTGPLGSKIINDTQKTLEDAKRYFEERNRGEQIQKIITESNMLSKDRDFPSTRNILEKTKEQIIPSQELKTTAFSAKRVAILLISSPEFRNLINDFLHVVRDRIKLAVEPQFANLEYSENPSTIVTFETESGPIQVEERSIQMEEKIGSSYLEKKIFKEEMKTKVDLRQVMSRLAYDPEFKLASQSLLNLISESRPESQKLGSSISETATNNHILQIREEAISLIAELCGREVIDNFLRDAWNVWVILAEDPMSTQYFDDIGNWMRATLENPQLLDTEDHFQRSEQLFARGNEMIFRYSQQEEFSRLLKEAQFIIQKIRNDRLTSALVEDFRALGRDLLLDENGRPSLQVTREALEEMKVILIPVLLEHLKEIPIPKIEGSTPKYKYSVENLVFYGHDIVPEQVKINLDTKMNVTPIELTTRNTMHSVLSFKLKNFKSHLRNLKFSFQRLKIPKIHDQGIADIDIFGDDNKVSLKWKLWYTQGQPTFELHKCKVHIRNVNIKITDSKHHVLENLIMKLFRDSIRREIELSISLRLAELLQGMATRLNLIADRSRFKLHPSQIHQYQLQDHGITKKTTNYIPHEMIHHHSTTTTTKSQR